MGIHPSGDRAAPAILEALFEMWLMEDFPSLAKGTP